VVNPADAGKLAWEPCETPNERNFMKQFTDNLLPSLQHLNLTEAEIAKVHIPVLTIHGRCSSAGRTTWNEKYRVMTSRRVANVGHFVSSVIPNQRSQRDRDLLWWVSPRMED
jgi:hypothetical protein